ncbi:putative oxidoreductase CipA-like protein [Rostrohypoxylon terebratum]|nr:putative oxidoreductase CipA-like protein [Rostrohypoxylon terebratum]
MSTISKVAVAGASGLLGAPVVKQLLEDGFQVTVLARKGTNQTFPATTTIVEVDYTSANSLVKALTGQDAVVSVLGFDGLPQQIPLIIAAVQAGVKRFLPSEFGGDGDNDKVSQLPMFRAKKATKDLLQREAAAGRITYSLVANGPFLDTALAYGMIVNLKDKKINLWDGGERRYSTTLLPVVAKAVAGVLRHPEETRNRVVFVRSASLTQKEVLERAKKVVGPDGWTVATPSVAESLEAAYAKMEKTGEVDRIAFITSAIWGEGYGSNWQKTDNELLGIKELSDAELEALMESFAK